MKRKLSLSCIILVIICIFSSGCVQDNGNGYQVTFNLLYSKPQLINNTTLYLDNELILQYENYSLDMYPPYVGAKTITLSCGDHLLKVIDMNFNQTKTRLITVEKRLYIDIIINDDYIDIDISEQQTGYK